MAEQLYAVTDNSYKYDFPDNICDIICAK